MVERAGKRLKVGKRSNRMKESEREAEGRKASVTEVQMGQGEVKRERVNGSREEQDEESMKRIK